MKENKTENIKKKKKERMNENKIENTKKKGKRTKTTI